MKNSYKLAKSLFPKNLISKHWDIYPSNFHEVLFNEDKLANFRRNELSFKFNDSLEKAILSRTKRVLSRLSEITGKEFIEKNKEILVGNPQTLTINNKPYDYHDLFIIYFLYALFPFLSEKNKKKNFLYVILVAATEHSPTALKKTFPMQFACFLIFQNKIISRITI